MVVKQSNMATEIKKIISRRDAAANWQSNNPVLASGEIGVDTTNKVMKIGNGSTPWNDLPSEQDKVLEKIVIVNDLTTGGADKSLSAEMGKKLNDTLFTSERNLYAGYALSGFINSSSGKVEHSDSLPEAAISEYIHVEGGKVYAISGRVENVAIRCLDSNGNPMKVLGASSGTSLVDSYYLPNPSGTSAVMNGQFKVPANAANVQFGISLRNESDRKITLELVGDQYNPNFTAKPFDGYYKAVIRPSLTPAVINNTAQLESLLLDVPEVDYAAADFTKGGYYQTDGVGLMIGSAVPLDYMSYIFLDVSMGEEYEVYVNGGSIARAWALLDSGNRVLSYADSTGWALRKVQIDNPSAKRLLVQSTSESSAGVGMYVKKIGQYGRVPQLERDVDELRKQSSSKSLKILCFGNSFTQDSMSYVPSIMRNVAPNIDLTIGMAVIGGCPLIQHLANFTKTSLSLDGTTYSPINYSYQKSMGGGAWTAVSADVDTMLADEKWDIVTFQQNGGTADKDFEVYYAPYIYPLIKSLFGKLQRNVKVGWLSIHGTYNNTSEALFQHWKNVVANTERVVGTSAVSVVFPYGTAVQNLRTVASINLLGDTGYLLADGGHLQDGIGCLCAAYCNTLKLLQLVGEEARGIIGEPTRITDQFLTDNNIQGTNLGTSGAIIGMTDENVYLAQIAATKAIIAPDEVTDLNANAI